jgi:hypothetical protein
MSKWVGFSRARVSFTVPPRAHGTSVWRVIDLAKFALHALTSYSAIPLQLVSLAGILSLLGAILLSIQTFVNYLNGQAVEGFTTVILVQLILGSFFLIGLGTLGLYVSTIFEEVKERPKYLVREVIGGEDKE